MSTNLPFNVEKYLKKYSLKKWELKDDKRYNIDAAVVIPGIKEYENINKLIACIEENDNEYLGRSLIIFVINNFSSSDSEVKKENKETIKYIRSRIEEKRINIGLVDASSEGLEMPEKDGGAGFARKIGMDLALSIFDYKSPSKKIIVSLDADCTVEKNYLSEIFKFFAEENSHAAVLRYRHDTSENAGQKAAIIFYEIFLRYYVLGLKFAGSAYAFHTIGSAMVCDHESYIRAEGMNKRKAAEDFYFLQKLAKNTEIRRIYSTTVFPSARASWRVPFGTGAKVSQFKPEEKNYLLYNPRIFRILKSWLSLLNNELSDAGGCLKSAGKISRGLAEFLVNQNFEKDFTNILKNSATPVQLQKQKIKWFDGFRTLKLIHYLSDTVYPMINMFEGLDKFFYMIKYPDKPVGSGVKIPPLETQEKYLEILRNLDDSI